MKEILYPKPLRKGDRIAVISPAGAVEPAQLEKGIKLIEDRGYTPVLGKNLYTHYSHGYGYAGTETERISDMNWALNDDSFAAIWTSRGGYGCQHLLKHLNFSGFKKHPKWFIGYSDNTVIQSLLVKHHYVSVHGQTLKTSSFGVTDESYNLIFDILQGQKPKYCIENHPLNKNGDCKGPLVGGNLALIYALLGTPFSFDFKDKILFIEDIGEKYYALDRMMISLDLAGVFKQIKGLIIGGMTNMGEEKDNKNYEESFDEIAYQIISERIKYYHFPSVFGFCNGHIYDNRPLIIGAEVHLKVGGKTTIEF